MTGTVEIELNTEEFNTDAEASSEGVVDETQSTDGGDPQLILGKFKTPEALAEAYVNLEKKLGSQGGQEQGATDATESEDTGDTTEQEGLEVTQDEEEQEAEEQEVPSGIDFEKYSQSILDNNGDLTKEDYQELQTKYGLPQHIVKAYVDGLAAQNTLAETKAESIRTKVYDSVGGKENYATMQKWMKGNLSREQIESYNQAVQSDNEFMVSAAASQMYSQFQSAMGSSGQNMIQGKPATSNGLIAFVDMSELSAAQADPRYKTDPAYRKEVEQRMALGFTG